MSVAAIIGLITTFGPLVVTGASAAANAINIADPALKNNKVFGAISGAINFLALNWVPKK